MSPSTLRRASGALLTLGGVAGALVPVLHPGHGAGYYTHPMIAPSHLLLFGAVLAVSLALPWLAVGAGAGRPTALLGTALYFVGLWCLDGTHGIIDGAVFPTLAATQPAVAAALAAGHASQDMLAGGPLGTITSLGIPAFVVGSVLLGVAIARARVLPRSVGWALAVAWVVAPLSFPFPELRALGVTLPYLALAAAGVAAIVSRAPRPVLHATAPARAA